MLDSVIAAREKAALQAYRHALDGAGSLRDRVKRLAKIRSEEGYMASVAAGTDGALLLIENHCPICVAARRARAFAARSSRCSARRWVKTSVSCATNTSSPAPRRCVYRIAAK